MAQWKRDLRSILEEVEEHRRGEMFCSDQYGCDDDEPCPEREHHVYWCVCQRRWPCPTIRRFAKARGIE